MVKEMLLPAILTAIILALLSYISFLKRRVASAYDEAKEICSFMNYYKKDLEYGKPLAVVDGVIYDLDIDEEVKRMMLRKKWLRRRYD